MSPAPPRAGPGGGSKSPPPRPFLTTTVLVSDAAVAPRGAPRGGGGGGTRGGDWPWEALSIWDWGTSWGGDSAGEGGSLRLQPLLISHRRRGGTGKAPPGLSRGLRPPCVLPVAGGHSVRWEWGRAEPPPCRGRGRAESGQERGVASAGGFGGAHALGTTTKQLGPPPVLPGPPLAPRGGEVALLPPPQVCCRCGVRDKDSPDPPAEPSGTGSDPPTRGRPPAHARLRLAAPPVPPPHLPDGASRALQPAGGGGGGNWRGFSGHGTPRGSPRHHNSARAPPASLQLGGRGAGPPCQPPPHRTLPFTPL